MLHYFTSFPRIWCKKPTRSNTPPRYGAIPSSMGTAKLPRRWVRPCSGSWLPPQESLLSPALQQHSAAECRAHPTVHVSSTLSLCCPVAESSSLAHLSSQNTLNNSASYSPRHQPLGQPAPAHSSPTTTGSVLTSDVSIVFLSFHISLYPFEW